VQAYTQVLAEAGDKPVVFRALDVGGDKVLPYLRQPKEENPALGWRAIRMSLDRPALFRTQIRAFLMAAGGRDLKFMLPMVTRADEIDAARAQIAKEITIVAGRGHALPRSIAIGAMLEVPSLLFELDALLRRVDFVSVGSNDLAQFLYAADRTNTLVSKRYDPLSAPLLRALGTIVKAAAKRRVPLTLCGELAGSPLTAMALVALGFRSISMPPASIGPVKSMILSLDAARAGAFLDEALRRGKPDIRAELESFAETESIEL
jgi:phosphotransferase system enzyme I (PtsP)